MASSWTREEEVYFIGNIFNINNIITKRVLNINPRLLSIRFRGSTILHRSIQTNNFEIFELCLDLTNKSYLEFKTNDSKEYTPLHLAVLYNRPLMIKALIEKEINVNIQDALGKIPLHYAVENLMVECTKLLYLTSDTKIIDKFGNDVLFSLLSTLSQENYGRDNIYSIIDMIFSVIDKDKTNLEGRSYLYYPVIYGYENIFKYLIAKGVNIYITDVNGKTIIDYAYETDNSRLTYFLENIDICI